MDRPHSSKTSCFARRSPRAALIGLSFCLASAAAAAAQQQNSLNGALSINGAGKVDVASGLVVATNSQAAPVPPGGAPLYWHRGQARSPLEFRTCALELTETPDASCPGVPTERRDRVYNLVVSESLGVWKFAGSQQEADVEAMVVTYVTSPAATSPTRHRCVPGLVPVVQASVTFERRDVFHHRSALRELRAIAADDAPCGTRGLKSPLRD